MPTPKQINYALSLLSKNGYSIKYMNSEFKNLGATVRERSGTVEEWLKRMNSQEISNLIKQLLEQ